MTYSTEITNLVKDMKIHWSGKQISPVRREILPIFCSVLSQIPFKPFRSHLSAYSFQGFIISKNTLKM